MKKYFYYLFFCLIFSLPFLTYGDEYYFALTTGHPFNEASLDAERAGGVELKFGDKVEIVYTLIRDDTVWFKIRQDEAEVYLPDPYLVKVSESAYLNNSGNLLIGYETVDKENAISLFYTPNDLVEISEPYKANGYEDRELLLRKEAAKAFTIMIDEAENDDVNIRIISAFRDSRYQSHLYKRALDRYGLDQASVAKPGHSEHQLGTTCDLTTDEIGYDLSRGFEETVAFRWIRDHAHRYGISYSFPKYKEKITGYIYEPWHFRYWGKERWRNYIDRMGMFFTR
ncbi:MAG: M15 family metallopeptidase [Spirochaetota bacterium]|nr:MAG: M15 family metallopeptidase [Spirochaetota bacterium]